MDKPDEVPSYTTEHFFEKRTKYAMIVPVINEGDRIRIQLGRMRPYLDAVDAFIVDGGSTDGSVSAEILRETGLRGFLLKTGDGKLSAQLRCGLAHCLSEGYEGVILMDGNNKDDPEAIPRFIEALDSGIDHIQGSRFVSGGKALNNPLSRLWGIKLIHAPLISSAAGVRYTDTTNGFRAYSKKLLVDKRVKPFRNIFSTYELHYYLAIQAGRLGFKVKEIPVIREYPAGEIPSKIGGFSGNMKIIKILINSYRGAYNP